MRPELFRPAKQENAYLKVGILGFAGSGKSRTAAEIAIGLHKHIKSKVPVSYLDTETGTDYLLPTVFKPEGVGLNVCKSRAFVDLLASVDEAERSQSILIIDSITHHWLDLCDSYRKRKGIERLVLHHWADIKKEWRPFSEKYINSRCHIIMCGRAGWEFDKEIDGEGFSELTKTGTKMKGEGEIGFEPSLLIEMEKVRLAKGKIGGNYKRRAWIIKDRFDVIDGKYFDDPTFKCFLPHVELLNLGGEHVGADVSKDSQALFKNGKSATEHYKQRNICVEEIDNELSMMFDSRKTEDKQARLKTLKDVFGTTSKTAIENLKLEDLKAGLKKIKALRKEKLNGKANN